jgi:hypothetical protein
MMARQMGRKARMTKMTGFVALLILIACGDAGAADYPFLDEMARYFQRIDTISVTSGDARDVNAVTHIIDPWPRYSRNRRIPANGERMVGAITRYRNPGGLGTAAAAPTLAPIIIPTSTGAAGGGGGGGYGSGQ